jgi:hypothetical protein
MVNNLLAQLTVNKRLILAVDACPSFAGLSMCPGGDHREIEPDANSVTKK